jgi:hypothetical protein
MKTVVALLLIAIALPAAAERYVVHFRKGPAWDESKAPNAQAHFADHSANLARLRKAEKLFLGARYGEFGMVVLIANDEAAARAEIEADPAIRAGVFAYTLETARFFYEPLGAPSTRTVTIPRTTVNPWLDTFEDGAKKHADAEWLAASAKSARESGLASTANYLDAASAAISGKGSVADVETAFRETLDAPVLVMLRIADAKLTDVVTAIPKDTKLDDAVRMFEKTLPGFEEAWLAPTNDRAVVASLRLRTGRSASSTGPGSYLPFDRAANVGRTWVIYDNVLPPVWFDSDIRPVAEKIAPGIAASFNGQSMLRWYALRIPAYDVGRNLTAAELDRLGNARDPLRIAKADLFCALISGAGDADIATLVAVTLHTLMQTYAGTAPPAHRPASAMLLNYAVERGAMQFDREKTVWNVDLAKTRDAFRTLALEILAIEHAVDVKRANALLDKYGATTPEIDRSVVAMARVPKITAAIRYMP